MTLAVIALGANIDDPVAQLKEAYKRLKKLHNLTAVEASPIYQSPPMGPQDQPPYYNAVVSGQFTGEPRALLVGSARHRKIHGARKKTALGRAMYRSRYYSTGRERNEITQSDYSSPRNKRPVIRCSTHDRHTRQRPQGAGTSRTWYPSPNAQCRDTNNVRERRSWLNKYGRR